MSGDDMRREGMRAIPVEEPYNLAGTLFPLRRGTGDPTMRIEGREAWRAARTPEGPASLRLEQGEGTVVATAWGPGAGWALDRAPGLIGAEDDLSAFEPRDDVMARVWKEHRGVRLTRALDVVRTLVAAVLEQKVVGLEARRAWRRMTTALSEPAPGEGGLLLPPDPARVAELPYYRFHPWGVERRRAEVVRAVCARAASLEALAEVPPAEARRRLEAMPGIGPWTAAEAARLSFGDPDAVSVGDYHVPNIVAWALAGEERGTDERMIELLEPYRGQRGRVQLLLEASQISPPAFGPRMEARSIDRL
jgi:3-methyladenine DNA glycosylase/8-oxoguanine DNA glycosylase